MIYRNFHFCFMSLRNLAFPVDYYCANVILEALYTVLEFCCALDENQVAKLAVLVTACCFAT